MVMLALLLALLLYSKSAYTANVQCTGYRYQLITDSAGSGSFLYRISVGINYGFGSPDSTCTEYRYKLTTDSAGSGSCLYRITVRINEGFGKIRILPFFLFIDSRSLRDSVFTTFSTTAF
jgi:hypothetical protein